MTVLHQAMSERLMLENLAALHTATPRHARTAGTDADTAAEDPSSAEPAKEMRQPDTTGRLAVYTGDTQRHEN